MRKKQGRVYISMLTTTVDGLFVGKKRTTYLFCESVSILQSKNENKGMYVCVRSLCSRDRDRERLPSRICGECQCPCSFRDGYA